MSGLESQDPDLMADIRNMRPFQCGEEAAKHFSFDAGYHKLNYGELLAFAFLVLSLLCDLCPDTSDIWHCH